MNALVQRLQLARLINSLPSGHRQCRGDTQVDQILVQLLPATHMVHRSLPNPIHTVVSPGSLRAWLWADPLRLQLGKNFFGLLLHLDGRELEMGWLARVRIGSRDSLGLFTTAISKVHSL